MKRIWDSDRKFAEGMILVFFLGAGFAFFLVNSVREYFIQQAGLISDFYFREMKYRSFTFSSLFPYLLGKRLKWAALLCAVEMTGMALGAAVLVAIWMGFSAGMIFSIAILKFGLRGIIIGGLTVLPQAFFYLWGFYLLLRTMNRWQEFGGLWNSFPGKTLAFAIAVLILDILTESYVNPFCLKLIYLLL